MINAISSLAGFVIGLLFGYLLRGVTDARLLNNEDWLARRWEVGIRATLGIAILLLAAYSTFITISTAKQLAADSACQAAANTSFQDELRARAASTKDANDAQLTFLTVEFDPTASAAAKATAGTNYLNAVRQQNAALEQHPLQVQPCP